MSCDTKTVLDIEKFEIYLGMCIIRVVIASLLQIMKMKEFIPENEL